MKNKIILMAFISFLLFGCDNEKVVAPNADYNIQILDKAQNVYVNLDRPFRLKVKTDYRVISENRSEYNAFYKGDSVKVNGVWTYYIYSPEPLKSHQGLALIYSNELKKSIVPLKYAIAGKYKVTFVAASVGNEGNVVEFAVNDTDSLTVIP